MALRLSFLVSAKFCWAASCETWIIADLLTSMSLGRLLLLPGRTGFVDRLFQSQPFLQMKASPPSSI